jgi:hypothetical protein
MSPGGASGVSGSSTGGSAGADACDSPPELLPEYAIAPSDVVWDRLTLFLHGATRAPFESLPSRVSADWSQTQVVAILEEQYAEDGRAPSGLEDFFREWALEGDVSTNAEYWASAFVRGNFVNFFDAQEPPTSFLTDFDFVSTYPNSTRRGIAMIQKLFCFEIALPPIEIEPVTVPPGKTRRQAIEEAVSDAVCTGCHQAFDPLGFSLEHYDVLGNYVDVENGLPIDSSGTYSAPSAYLQFSGIDDLSPQFPALCEVQSCFAERLLRYALAQAYGGDPPAYDASELRYVIREFREGDLELARLLMAIASTPAFLRE